MSAGDAFPYFWLALVAAGGIVNAAWAINDLKRGSARFSWYSSRANRDDEPFEFWMAVLGKFAAVPVTGFMFWFGLDMLKW